MSTTTAFPTAQDLNDLQGDVVLGIPKRAQDFLFFTIKDAAAFRQSLKELTPKVTTTSQVKQIRENIKTHKDSGAIDLIEVSCLNISFTFTGLTKLGITDSLSDSPFQAGMLNRARALGDQGTTDVNGTFVPDWMDLFKGEIDGLIISAGDSRESVNKMIKEAKGILGASIKQLALMQGSVRPGADKGHEHFGYADGISLPSIPTLNGQFPGQQEVKPGVLICGQPGDIDAKGNQVLRPSWAKNGSFLCYRHLYQLVPEFDKYLADNALKNSGVEPSQGSELLGARFFGRWKSGAPIATSPFADDSKLAKQRGLNNNFDYSTPADQTNCPFSAHIRKMNPRSDITIPNAVAQHQIMRASIPFGPEVTEEEKKSNKTKQSRGLSFVCYQSSLSNGFEFLQQNWANNKSHPPNKIVNYQPFDPGFDPVVGQNNGDPRKVGGTDPKVQSSYLTLSTDFVETKGGAYFFVPSLTALRTKLAA